MARGGINKVLVQRARDVVRSRGDYPSIDAVRIELGNTGSKTTIHRYLKELEEAEGSRLDDQALLSDTLKEMVARLAARLQEEARELVASAETAHQARAQEWQALDASRQAALDAAAARSATLETQLEQAGQERSSLRDRLQAVTLEANRQAQRIADLEILLAEKASHLQSLEEKHRHARDAMEHYRQSVKEQRDQDQRRHEQQVQQLMAEQRQLQQTLSMKHTEITQLNKDNARLLAELGEARKQVSAAEVKRDGLEERARAAGQQAAALTARLDAARQRERLQADQLKQWQSRCDDGARHQQQLAIELAGLRAELAIKSGLLEELASARRQSAPPAGAASAGDPAPDRAGHAGETP